MDLKRLPPVHVQGVMDPKESDLVPSALDSMYEPGVCYGQVV